MVSANLTVNYNRLQCFTTLYAKKSFVFYGLSHLDWIPRVMAVLRVCAVAWILGFLCYILSYALTPSHLLALCFRGKVTG